MPVSSIPSNNSLDAPLEPWFDPSQLSVFLKVLKKIPHCVLEVKTIEQKAPNYEISFSKDDMFWSIKEFINDELITVQQKRRMRSWFDRIDDVAFLVLRHDM